MAECGRTAAAQPQQCPIMAFSRGENLAENSPPAHRPTLLQATSTDNGVQQFRSGGLPAQAG